MVLLYWYWKLKCLWMLMLTPARYYLFVIDLTTVLILLMVWIWSLNNWLLIVFDDFRVLNIFDLIIAYNVMFWMDLSDKLVSFIDCHWLSNVADTSYCILFDHKVRRFDFVMNGFDLHKYYCMFVIFQVVCWRDSWKNLSLRGEYCWKIARNTIWVL
jgi:hypothetical protein